MKKVIHKIKQFIYPEITANHIISSNLKFREDEQDKLLDAYILSINGQLEPEEVKFYLNGDKN